MKVDEADDLATEILSKLANLLRAHPIEAWHEDTDGDVLWWCFPIEEPPYVGTPNDTDWPGYHTHFSPIPVPTQSHFVVVRLPDTQEPQPKSICTRFTLQMTAPGVKDHCHRVLQEALNNWSKDTLIKLLVVDGAFGHMTQTVVRHFQVYNGLDIDGVVGPLTWKALESYL